jgi:hypothetical protein
MKKISRSHLQPIIQRIDSRLPGWMPRMLGAGSRIQLINSVLSAIPNYFMACIKWDKTSTDAIDKLTRGFLWKNRRDILGGHCLLSWEVVTMPKEQGGLGIRNLLKHNQALLANLTNKLLTGGVGPCFGWLKRWYLQQSIPDKATINDTPFWKIMVKHISVVQETTKCCANSGTSIAFWNDLWTELGKLRDAFSILYTFALDSTCTVASQKDANGWNIQLHERLSHTAQQQLVALQAYLTDKHPTLNGNPDSRALVTTGKKPTTKDYYRLLCDRGVQWLPHGWVWIRAIPLSQKFFLWLAYHGRLNTKDNMTNKQWRNDAGCDLCPAVESIAHIAMHCKHSAWVWEKWNLNEAALKANTISEFVQQIQGTKNGKSALAWPVCFAAAVYCLWKMRNDRIFNNKRPNRRQLLTQVADLLKLWAYRSGNLSQELRTWALELQV